MNKKRISIIYRDDSVVVCEKPAGMPVQSDKSRDIDLETSLKLDLIKGQNPEKEPYLTAVHRLDRPVGGLMAFARTKEAAAELSRQIQEGSFEKNYQAIVCGELREEAGSFEDYLARDGKTNTSKVVDKKAPGAKYASLDYELIDCIESDKGILSWVLIDLHTGRHHQIRVQFASRGMGLYGDRKYNPIYQRGGKGFIPLGLYATRLSFNHPETGERMTFKTEPKGKAFELMDVEAY